jgi:DhnA family fructose-bisphosphate aldolase class Ia
LKKTVARIDRILHEKRALLLALDDAVEDGPGAFTLTTIDPTYGLRIALEGKYTGVVVNAGIAEKYFSSAYRDVPLIINLNAIGSLHDVHLDGRQTCSVERAVKLGAQAVGYILDDGARSDPARFVEFGQIVEHAHDYGIPVIAWLHPRGKHAHSRERDAYLARVALELGADAISVQHAGDQHAFEWIVKCAGHAAVLVTQSEHTSTHAILTHVQQAVHAGAIGAVYGKTVVQHAKPFSLTRAISAVIFKDKAVVDAEKYLA